jgi:hypothetical protein
MGKAKKTTKKSNEIVTPVLLDTDVEEIQNNQEIINTPVGIIFFDTFQERNNKMINSINDIVQTIQPLSNVLFNGSNVRTNNCSNGCCGWLSHNENSGIFTLTKAGIYRVHFNANVTNTVAVAPITLNLTNAGESITGGAMTTTPAAIGGFENVSAEILVRVPCNGSVVITVKNNTPTNPIQVNNPSITITREA